MIIFKNKILNHISILFISLLIVLFVFFIYIYNKTIIPSNASILKNLNQKGYINVDIKEITSQRKEVFALFTYGEKEDERIGMIYYEPSSVFKNRYKFSGSSGTNINYGNYYFAKSDKKGLEILNVVFGFNNKQDTATMELNFDNMRLSVNLNKQRYFLKIYRFLDDTSIGSPLIRFYDKSMNDITYIFWNINGNI